MKKILLILLIIITIGWAVSIITGYTLVVATGKTELSRHNYQVGDTVQPFADFDFKKDHWTAYLVLSGENSSLLTSTLHDSIKKVTCQKTSDRGLLEKMKTDWKFIYTGGDVVTVTDHIYLVRNGSIVFSSAIIIDNVSQGLQGEFGWIEPINENALSETCKQFERVYLPIIIL